MLRGDADVRLKLWMLTHREDQGAQLILRVGKNEPFSLGKALTSTRAQYNRLGTRAKNKRYSFHVRLSCTRAVTSRVRERGLV